MVLSLLTCQLCPHFMQFSMNKSLDSSCCIFCHRNVHVPLESDQAIQAEFNNCFFSLRGHLFFISCPNFFMISFSLCWTDLVVQTCVLMQIDLLESGSFSCEGGSNPRRPSAFVVVVVLTVILPRSVLCSCIYSPCQKKALGGNTHHHNSSKFFSLRCLIYIEPGGKCAHLKLCPYLCGNPLSPA